MSTTVRHRNKNNSKLKKQSEIDGINHDDKTLQSDVDKLKELNRDSGDGESAPHTPPPEFEEEKSVDYDDLKGKVERLPKETRKAKKLSKAEGNSQSGLTLTVDAVGTLLFVLALATRLYKIDTPNAVVFDELHFGKYASLYVNNTFFFDSQPPLGKQIVALAAYAVGFGGDFKFERIGQPYDETVPVRAMRFVPAFFGSLLVPTVYALVKETGASRRAAVLAALFVVLDNALLTQSRFILMEPLLLFFGTFGLLFVLRFRNEMKRPYTAAWFAYLFIAVLSLSAAFCVRYFGLFTLFLGVALITKDFWDLVGDRAVSEAQLAIHLVIRAVHLVVIPVALYLLVLFVHLTLLYKAGPNDNVMTSAFQASLEGGLASIVQNQPVQVVHGSQITLRHTHGRTCWLHSHDEVFPVKYADDRGSSHQQQVTCYSYKDVNNWWIVKKPDVEELAISEPLEPLRNGDVVQIIHGLTSRALNSHDVAAAMSPQSQEVACYIDYNVSMTSQNLWRVELLNKETTDGMWHAVQSELRLVHVNTSSSLKVSGRQLPDWGFRQHEVVADKATDIENSVWNVEEHRYSREEDQKEREKELIRTEMIPTERRNLSFYDKAFELQYKMLFNNQENVAGHMYASEPLDWLSLKRGVAYWISPDSNAQVHFLGNPVLWLTASLGLVAYFALFIFYLLRRERACFDISESEWNFFCTIGEVFISGFLLHFLPFLLVERTLFLHHYMPAYLFKICLLACLIDHLWNVLSYFVNTFGAKSGALKAVFGVARGIFAVSLSLWFLAVVVTFVKFAPISLGSEDLTSEQIESLTWRSTWDFIIHKQ